MTGWTDEARKAALEARRRKAMGKMPKYTKAQKATIGFKFHGIPSTPKHKATKGKKMLSLGSGHYATRDIFAKALKTVRVRHRGYGQTTRAIQLLQRYNRMRGT